MSKFAVYAARRRREASEFEIHGDPAFADDHGVEPFQHHGAALRIVHYIPCVKDCRDVFARGLKLPRAAQLFFFQGNAFFYAGYDIALLVDQFEQRVVFRGVERVEAVSYTHLDEMSVDAAQTAVDLDLPLFIAQGEKDWQVRPADGVEAWQAKLPQDFDAVYKLYPDMTHMLFDLQGTPTGTAADYMAADARVSETLIEDIATWIAAR